MEPKARQTCSEVGVGLRTDAVTRGVRPIAGMETGDHLGFGDSP